jgi:hypothetical protein
LNTEPKSDNAVTLTVFGNEKSFNPKITQGQLISAPFKELKQIFQARIHSGQTYRDGKRNEESCMGMQSLFFLDIDEGTGIDEAVRVFGNYKHIIYTSRSHQKPKKSQDPCDRYRVVLFLSRPIDQKEIWRATKHFIECETGIKNDPVVNWAGFFFPGDTIYSMNEAGVLLAPRLPEDWQEAPDAADSSVVMWNKYYVPGKGVLTRATRYFLEHAAPNGEYNGALFKAAADCKDQGYTEEEFRGFYLACGDEPKKHQPKAYFDDTDDATIDSAFKRSRKAELRLVSGIVTKSSVSGSGGFCFDVDNWPITTGTKYPKPVACIENTEHLLKSNRIYPKYDIIRKDLDLVIPGESYLKDTERNCRMTRIVSLALSNGLPRGGIEDFVISIASQNPYNPVAEWVLSKPWDGQSRLNDFYETVEAVGESDPKVREFKELLLRRWMVSAIAAAFEPTGIQAHGVLVFKGPQYMGKTNWFNSLVPKHLELTKDGVTLDPKDKDSVYQCVCKWLVELGELDATIKKADIANLKSFLTQQQDELRLPYERSSSKFVRRTVFFGSVNENDYLNDPTGNRRFWTIDCKSIDYAHHIDMQQLWAEFHDLYSKGELWYLAKEEMQQLNEHNKEFEAINPMEEMMRGLYDWGKYNAAVRITRFLTATEIAMEMGIKLPTQRDIRHITKAISDITGQKRKTIHGKRGFDIPDLLIRVNN